MTTIRNDTDLETAALFGCAVTTGFGVIVNNARLSIGESVVIYGAGGVGLNIVQAASMVSAYPIIAVDLYDSKLDLAMSLGATHRINARKQDAREAIQDIVKEFNGLDVFIDNTGIPSVIEMAYQITKPQSRVILVGVPRVDNNISIYSLPLHFGKQITGSHGGEAKPSEDIPRLMNLYNNDRLNLKELVTDYFTLDEINIAIDKMRSGEITGRCMIRMDA